MASTDSHPPAGHSDHEEEDNEYQSTQEEDDEDNNSQEDYDDDDEEEGTAVGVNDNDDEEPSGSQGGDKERAREKEALTILIKQDDKRSLVAGDYYYLVDKTWWKQWKYYVNYDIIGSSQYNEYPRPGPINNSNLLEDDGETVKRSLTENFDFMLFNKEIWDKIHSWYGGGPAIPRKCVATGKDGKKLFVEYRPLKVKVIYSKRPKTFEIVAFSKATKIGEFIDEMEKRLHFNRQKIRAWDFHQGNKIKHLNDMNSFFDDVQILDGQYMLIEEQRKDGRWPNDKIYQMYSSGRSSLYSNREPTPPGKTGLVNLGNTCFMNSALQCLCHTVPLVDFILSGSYKPDVNRTNPLGMFGEIAEEFSDLLKEVWSERTAISEPRQFKKAIEKFAPRFSGYQQHDSQELLAFLLDGLHEDLNRVIDKPYVEKVEGGRDKDDIQVAKDAWNGHLKRNRSIIVDLIQGQLKSTLTCPVDQYVSITFDPFMYLTVQLPVETTRKIVVKLYFLERDSLPIKYGVVVDKEGIVKDLKKALSKQCDIDPERLVIVDMHMSKFHSLLVDQQDVSDIKTSDKIHAHEILLTPSNVPKIVKTDKKEEVPAAGAGTESKAGAGAGSEALAGAPAGHEDKQSQVEHEEESEEEPVPIVHLPVLFKKEKRMELFGTPFIVSVPKNITYRRLYAHIIDRLHGILKKEVDPDIPLDEEATDEEDGNNATSDEDLSNNAADSSSSKNRALFTIVPETNWSQKAYNFPNDDSPLELSERQTIALVWNKAARQAYYDNEKAQSYHSDPSMDNDSATDISSKMNLYECLNLYNKEEQLGPNDTWYCGQCKEFRQAYKKFDIWSAPNILIIHLKRFSYRHRIREKLDNVIDCPLENLDMSKYVIGPTPAPPFYDLYAVSNHYGSMGGGHYTAYAKHRDDGKWYCYDDHNVRPISEQQVISDAAYVLFYKRKDTDWPKFNPAYDVLKDSDDEESEETEEEESDKPEERAGVSTTQETAPAGVSAADEPAGVSTTEHPPAGVASTQGTVSTEASAAHDSTPAGATTLEDPPAGVSATI